MKSTNLLALLTPLDITLFFLILVITVLFAYFGDRKKNSTNKKSDKESPLEILLMGRRLTLPLFIATLVATWYGGIFGVTEITFTKGIYNFLTQGIFWYVAYLLFAFFLVERIKGYEAVTLPDLLGKMFGKRSKKVGAIFTFFNILPISYVISVGLFLQILFGGNLLVMMIIGVAIVLFYISFGGFKAVVYSDLFQFFVMCSSVALLLFVSIQEYGGYSFLKLSLPPAHFNWTSDETLLSTMVWGFIALATLVDPSFYQRCFAAKDTKTAKRGILISTLIWFCFDICTTGGALYARAIMPDAEPGHAYMAYAIHLLPSGFRGFFLAGILATILSTLSSFLFIASTTISVDLFPSKRKLTLLRHHIFTILIALVAILMATLFEGSVKSAWKTLGSYASASLLLPMMLGHIFKNRISDMQFVTASLTGAIFLTLFKLTPLRNLLPLLEPFYVGLLGTLLGILLFPIVRITMRKLRRA